MTLGKDQSNPPIINSETNTVLYPSSPYYVHPSDNPTSAIYTPLLNSENYCTWGRGMMKALSAKGKTGYIDGTVKKPTNPSDLPHWTRCDDLVGSWISNSVDPEIHSSTMNFPSAQEQWMEIKSRFFHHNASKLKKLYAKSSLGKIHGIPAGLHERFSPMRSQIMLMEPMPSPAKIYNHFRQEEEHQGIHSSSVPSIESATLKVFSGKRINNAKNIIYIETMGAHK
ncbi:uncharacterized protein LOC113291681 [Papaver somniferum]|uniref:uncharacterized protein LOC113291681 n=1 Tax=Papaver somniferum TaxID=3469 RepID=UPI000E6F8F4F|nr:uncharacterized protein LOC113291681 [Papaver somniferum]